MLLVVIILLCSDIAENPGPDKAGEDGFAQSVSSCPFRTGKKHLERFIPSCMKGPRLCKCGFAIFHKFSKNGKYM